MNDTRLTSCFFARESSTGFVNAPFAFKAGHEARSFSPREKVRVREHLSTRAHPGKVIASKGALYMMV